MTKSCIRVLVCSECATEFDHKELQTYCEACNKPLLTLYDLERAKVVFKRDSLNTRNPDLWRYRELLPLLNVENAVSFGEGMTPLISLVRLNHKYGVKRVYIKDEGQIPTASFKARGLSMAVSKAKELGVKKVAIPTAGNAGGALASYAARAGIACYVFMPEDTPRPIYLETKSAGAEVTLVDGLISDCGKMVAERKVSEGWFDVSTLKEPYRLEGKKTMGYELAEQFGWRLPDVIIYPTGGGTGLIGMWKAFAELRELGWLTGDLPRMVSVQSSGCDPITRAFESGQSESEFFENAETCAAGLRVPKAFGDKLVLNALRESGGFAVSVTESEILQSLSELARSEGFVSCPEGAATWAALKKLKSKDLISSDDETVLFNTGAGIKYPDVLAMALNA